MRTIRSALFSKLKNNEIMKSILVLAVLTSSAIGQLTFNAGITSDYIARGTSQTLGDFGIDKWKTL